jgi:hypothetical protein
VIEHRLQRLAAHHLGLTADDVTVAWDPRQRLYTVRVPPQASMAEVRRAVTVDRYLSILGDRARTGWSRAVEALGAEVRADILVILDDGFAARLDAEHEAGVETTVSKLPPSMGEVYRYASRLSWEGQKTLHLAHVRAAKIADAHGREAAILATRHEVAGAQADIARGEALAGVAHRYLDLIALTTATPLRFTFPPGAPPCSPPSTSSPT